MDKINFWKRLEMFVENVQVNDAMSEEEKAMIVRIAQDQQKLNMYPEFMQAATHTELNRDQKLLAIKLRYYDGLDWQPKKGDYYTSCRNDLELYQIVDEDENYFMTNYCNPTQTTPNPAQWPKADFKKGFWDKRIYVPLWILE